MPLSRSNTGRGKSRSPVPPTSPLPPSSRPQNFFPPSHYAAAAGITYPTRPPIATEHDSIISRTSDKHSNRDSFVPISYPSQSLSSDSSFEFKAISLPQYTTSPSRKSKQLGNIPHLETQLIPSLRDTIDRMTRPPSLINSPGSAHLDLPTRGFGRSTSPSFSSATSAAPSFSSTSSGASTSTRSSFSSFRPRYSSESAFVPLPSGNSPGTPPSLTHLTSISTYNHGSNQSAPTTPTQKPKPKPKSALKSALRPPTPKISLRAMVSPPLLQPAKNDAVPGNGSSMRTAKMPTPTLDASKTRQGRTRARTDPGICLPNPPAHIIPESTNSISFVSHLPRRVQPMNEIRSRPVATNEDSRLSCDTGPCSGRRLVVANATVVPSSSSEEEQQDISSGGLNLQNSEERTTRAVYVGLGLSYGCGGDGEKFNGRKGALERLQVDYGDDSSHYDSDIGPSQNANVGGWDAKPLPFRPRDSNHSSRTSVGSNQLEDDAHRRRRESLLKILSGIELPGSGIGENAGGEESDYCGEEGLAISVSGDLTRVNVEVRDEGRGVCRARSSSGYSIPAAGFEADGRTEGNDRQGRIEKGSTTNTLTPLFSAPAYGDDFWSRNKPRTSTPSGRRSMSHGPLSSSPRPSSAIGHRKNDDRTRKSPPQSPTIRTASTPVVPPDSKRRSTHRDIQQQPHSSPRPLHVDTCSEEKYPAPRPRVPNRAYTDSDAIRFSLVENSYAAASRERKALGILPSVSDYFTGGSEETGVDCGRSVEGEEGRLIHVESDASLVGSVLLREEEGWETGDLSAGAESLFRSLSGRREEGQWRRSRRSRPHSAISRSSSASSVYDDVVFEDPNQQDASVFPAEIGTWRSTLTPSCYDSLMKRHGEKEMQRQEVIWELCSTEEEFVDRLHSIIRLFILPLRVQNSKTWIIGVPSEVARLFDWLEDIVNLHTQTLSVLNSTREVQHPVVENVAEALRGFVLRLEVYQPYLVRIEDVARMIRGFTSSSDGCDFGEFVKIQDKECGDGWALQRLLVEPVNRLARYPDFFRRLQLFTPKSHPDYVPTFALMHSTDIVIRVITEVKKREEEYDLVKRISASIRGLPSTVHLARRERRLLCEGLLFRVNSVDGNPTINPGSRDHSFLNHTDESAQPDSDLNSSQRNSRLFEAINEWGIRPTRSGSVRSNASSAMSFKSYEPASTTSSEDPTTPSSGNFSKFHYSVASPSRATVHEPSHEGHSLTSPRIPAETSKACEVYVFVFTDLVLLVTPLSENHSRLGHDPHQWQILDGIGVARVLGVTELAGDLCPVFTLDLLPIEPHGLDTGVIPDTSSVTTIHLAVREYVTSTKPPEPDDGDRRQQWLSAFQQCFQSTLRSLSFPSHSGRYLIRGPNADLEADTHDSVMAILNSGLPIPKSPSMQIEDAARGHAGDTRRQEREERGWWSLRFQQVLREMQRLEVPLMFTS